MELIRRHFTVIDSTNTWGKQRAHELLHDKITLVTADSQTAGRGRFKRRWESPPGQNIYATFCFFVEKHRTDIGNIPQVLSLSAADALKEIGFTPQLKWPNDLLLSGKKVGGILAETTPLSDLLCVVIGIGLNINMPLETLQKIDRPATSLLVEAGHSFDVETVLAIVQQKFVRDLDIFLDESFIPFLESYRQQIAHTPSLTIRFNDNRKVWEGTLHAINNDGSLSLRLQDGEIKTFIVGEILF